MHPYQTSRDYPRLIQLMKEGHRLVCLVDYRFSSDAPDEPPCRDICHTRAGPPDPASQYQEVRSLWYLAVGCRGIEYIGGIRDTEEAFIAQCTRANLEWLVPSALPTAPVLHERDHRIEFLMRFNQVVKAIDAIADEMKGEPVKYKLQVRHR